MGALNKASRHFFRPLFPPKQRNVIDSTRQLTCVRTISPSHAVLRPDSDGAHHTSRSIGDSRRVSFPTGAADGGRGAPTPMGMGRWSLRRYSNQERERTLLMKGVMAMERNNGVRSLARQSRFIGIGAALVALMGTVVLAAAPAATAAPAAGGSGATQLPSVGRVHRSAGSTDAIRCGGTSGQ